MALLGHLEFRLCVWVVRQADNTRGVLCLDIWCPFFLCPFMNLASRRSLLVALLGNLEFRLCARVVQQHTQLQFFFFVLSRTWPRGGLRL